MHDLSAPQLLLLRAVGTRQFFSFTTATTRQRNRRKKGEEKNGTMLRYRCLNGVATINIVIAQQPTTLRPENMVTLSLQGCRVPSSATTTAFVTIPVHSYNL